MTIILDIDGTLINSSNRHYLLLEELLKSENMKVHLDKEDYLNYKRSGGNNLNYMISRLLLDEEVACKINQEWIAQIENKNWIKYDNLYEDTIDFLENIKKRNVNIYYLSSRHNKENLMDELEELGIKKYANQIYIVDTKNQIEEKRKIISKIKKEHQDSIYMIGDTEVDYYSAEKNNIKYMILNRGFRSKSYFDKINIKTYNNLFNVLGGLENGER